MRIALSCAAFAVVAAGLWGCDSQQPLQGGSVDAVLTIDTTETTVSDVNIWELWEDSSTPPDGIPDRPIISNGFKVYRCEGADTVPRVTRYPWAFSAQVSILRKGATSPEIVSSTYGGTSRFTAITRFIESDAPVPIPDAAPGGDGFPRNGIRVSTANPAFPLYCDLNHPEFEANIGQIPNPATIALNPGDTLIVEARKATIAQNPIASGVFPNPLMFGALTVAGVPVTPTRGNPQSSPDDGAGISFSYTLN